MAHISASLLAADYARLGEEVQRAQSAGVDSFHFDMMDGHYVPNLALTPQHLIALRAYTTLPFYTHLEVSNPDEILSRFNSFSTDMIIVQRDTLPCPQETFDRIRSNKTKVGLGLSPDDEIEDAVRFFRDIDLLLILGVYPGFGGQAMQPGTIEKIQAARAIAIDLNLSITIAVDGGVRPTNAISLIEAGADCLIMGTALFHSHDMKQTVAEIREAFAL